MNKLNMFFLISFLPLCIFSAEFNLKPEKKNISPIERIGGGCSALHLQLT